MKDISELMNFLGLCCFIKQYVRNYARYSTVMSDLIGECTRKNGGGWNWNHECQEAFDNLKEAVMNPINLSSITYSDGTKLHCFTDCAMAAGCVIWCHFHRRRTRGCSRCTCTPTFTQSPKFYSIKCCIGENSPKFSGNAPALFRALRRQ